MPTHCTAQALVGEDRTIVSEPLAGILVGDVKKLGLLQNMQVFLSHYLHMVLAQGVWMIMFFGLGFRISLSREAEE